MGRPASILEGLPSFALGWSFGSKWTFGCLVRKDRAFEKSTWMFVNSNLVDSASSHTLVSKIKPCMSKYKRLYTVKLRTAH